jgi:multiple sugar transport system permease protein
MAKIRKTTVILLATLLALVSLFPIYWAASTSLKSEHEVIAVPPTWVTLQPTLSNYRDIFSHPEDTPVLRWFINSSFVAIVFSLLAVTVCVLAAYSLARFEFKGKRLYLGLMLGSLVIPGIVLLIPNYVIVDRLGWTDTYAAVIFPGLGGVFGVLLLRQFFLTLPIDLEEAAMMDGAASWQVLLHVLLPLSKPIIITLFVMSFMGSWNDYFWPLITLYSPEMRTLPVGMAALQGRYIHHYGSMMAGAMLIAIPSILLFIFVQRYYIRSIAQTGLKS